MNPIADLAMGLAVMMVTIDTVTVGVFLFDWLTESNERPLPFQCDADATGTQIVTAITAQPGWCSGLPGRPRTSTAIQVLQWRW